MADSKDSVPSTKPIVRWYHVKKAFWPVTALQWVGLVTLISLSLTGTLVLAEAYKALKDYRGQQSSVAIGSRLDQLGKGLGETNKQLQGVISQSSMLVAKINSAADINIKIAQQTNAKTDASAGLTEKVLASAGRITEHLEKSSIPKLDANLDSINAAVGTKPEEGFRGLVTATIKTADAVTDTVNSLNGEKGPIVASTKAIASFQDSLNLLPPILENFGLMGTEAREAEEKAIKALFPPNVNTPFGKRVAIWVAKQIAPDVLRDGISLFFPLRVKEK